MWCFILSTKTHFSKQIPWKALPCSPANVPEVISVCSFSLSPIWLSRGTDKDSCSAVCHPPALETCSLVCRLPTLTNKTLQIHSPDAKLHHPPEATGTKLVNDSWRYGIAAQNLCCCLRFLKSVQGSCPSDTYSENTHFCSAMTGYHMVSTQGPDKLGHRYWMSLKAFRQQL